MYVILRISKEKEKYKGAVGNKYIRGCISCNSCVKNGKCFFNDAVN